MQPLSVVENLKLKKTLKGGKEMETLRVDAKTLNDFKGFVEKQLKALGLNLNIDLNSIEPKREIYDDGFKHWLDKESKLVSLTLNVAKQYGKLILSLYIEIRNGKIVELRLDKIIDDD